MKLPKQIVPIDHDNRSGNLRDQRNSTPATAAAGVNPQAMEMWCCSPSSWHWYYWTGRDYQKTQYTCTASDTPQCLY